MEDHVFAKHIKHELGWVTLRNSRKLVSTLILEINYEYFEFI